MSPLSKRNLFFLSWLPPLPSLPQAQTLPSTQLGSMPAVLHWCLSRPLSNLPEPREGTWPADSGYVAISTSHSFLDQNKTPDGVGRPDQSYLDLGLRARPYPPTHLSCGQNRDKAGTEGILESHRAGTGGERQAPPGSTAPFPTSSLAHSWL